MPSLFGGVSRQPRTLRRNDQVEEIVNGLVTVARGIEKRPGSLRAGKLPGTAYGVSTDVGTHWIDRDSNERYVVLHANDGTTPLEVYQFTGSSVTKMKIGYASAAAKTYVTSAKANLGFLTIVDTTLIYNRDVTVATLQSSQPNYGIAMFTISGGDLVGRYSSVSEFPGSGTTNKFYYADKAHPYRAADPSLEVDLKKGYYKTQANAREYTIGGTDFKYERRWVETADLLPRKYNCSKWDNPANQAVMEDPVYLEVKKNSPAGPIGWRKGVYNSGDDKFDYTRFPEPGVPDCYFNADTMPVQLVRKVATSGDVAAYPSLSLTAGDVFFEVSVRSWKPRFCGDNDTNKKPGFIGKKISALTLFRDRLVIAAGEGITCSEAGDYSNFWLVDYTDVVDSDRIDIQTSTTRVTPITHLVPFSGVLEVFTESGIIFELRSDESPLTPTSANLVPTLKYDNSPDVMPVTEGKQLYFVTEGAFPLTVYEYYLQAGNGTGAFAYNVTAHCESYVPAGATQLASSEKHGTLVVFNSTYSNKVWPYRYFWIADEKAQSAWSTWEFADVDAVLGGTVIDDDLWLLVRQAYYGGTYTEASSVPTTAVDGATYTLVRISLRERAGTDDLTFFPGLDWSERLNMASLPGSYSVSYNNITDRTTLTVPFVDACLIYKQSTFELIHASGVYAGKRVLPFSYIVNTGAGTMSFVFNGRYNEGIYYFGRNFNHYVDIGDVYVRDSQGNTQNLGTTTIRTVTVNYKDTGYFEIQSVGPLGSVRIAKVSPAITGGPSSVTDGRQIKSGKYETTLLFDSGVYTLRLSNNTPMPSNFTQLDFTVEYSERWRS